MGEREEHNELIQRIAESLRNHTEPYKEGAWERFAAAHVKRKRKLWPYASAAAVLLVAAGWHLSTRYGDTRPQSPQLVRQEVIVTPADTLLSEEQHLEGLDAEMATDDPGMPQDRGAVTGHEPHREAEQRLADAPVPVRGEVTADDAVVDHRAVGRSKADEPTVVAAALADTTTVTEPGPRRLAAAMEKDISGVPTEPGVQPLLASGRAGGKWDLGLMVSPSLTSEAINLGGGITVAYRISDKFSIGSGIAVAQLGVGENPGLPSQSEVAFDSPSPNEYFNGQSGLAVNYKKEVSITSSVVTLDIPLDLRYDVANGFYTSVGVSYVAVLDERRTGHYVDRLNKNTFASGRLSTADRVASTEFVYSSERIAAKPLQGNGYAGFMNFSIGKRLPLSSKLFLSVEPYFKLPIGRLSKEEMNFTNGGLRIVTGF